MINVKVECHSFLVLAPLSTRPIAPSTRLNPMKRNCRDDGVFVHAVFTTSLSSVPSSSDADGHADAEKSSKLRLHRSSRGREWQFFVRMGSCYILHPPRRLYATSEQMYSKFLNGDS